MNPSAADILEAIEAVPTDDVLVLPNNSNVILTAEQAATMSGKNVRIVPSQVGTGRPGRDDRLHVVERRSRSNEQAMLGELEGAATGEITIASRDVTLDGVEIRKGEYLGLVDDAAVASRPDVDAVVQEVVDRVLAGGQEYLTILTGEDAPPLDGLVVGARAASPRARGRDPRRRAAALPAPRRRSVTDVDEPIRVLLVEDNDVYRDSLVFLLGARVGLDVVGAVADGASAIRACREHEPDVVVLDYRLPDVDGAAVAPQTSPARSSS